ncbi:hypothetical protein AAULR_03599 [Lacticaseibacillus rhamnosus MTCC 5462]|nr:hypothetical protein AAULR_03599 [Lacticaseibacillus rhamnosus MTCC 5462]
MIRFRVISVFRWALRKADIMGDKWVALPDEVFQQRHRGFGITERGVGGQVDSECLFVMLQ